MPYFPNSHVFNTARVLPVSSEAILAGYRTHGCFPPSPTPAQPSAFSSAIECCLGHDFFNF